MSESRVWVTADHHFGHTNIIKYCNRPFTSLEQMNEELVNRWNALVRPEDVVFHLGDFTLGRAAHASDFLQSLNGKKILVFGNHDRKEVQKVPEWLNCFQHWEFDWCGFTVKMQHHPYQHALDENTLYLHGHCHGNLGTFHNNQIDVGVDCWDYQPVELEKLIELKFG